MNTSSRAAITTAGNSHIGAMLAAPLHQSTPIAMTRVRREVHNVEASAPRSQRDQGNGELAASYAQALADRTRDEDAVVSNIPAHSTFGQWRSQLREALENKDFLKWLEAGSYRPATLKILPDGALSIKNSSGVQTLFTLRDNSPWATFAGPILSAAKAYAPDGITHSALYANSAPLTLIAQFYGETIHKDSAKDRLRAQELQQTNAFVTAGIGAERSEEALQAQKAMPANQRDVLSFRDALFKVSAYLDEQKTIHGYHYLKAPNPPPFDRDAGLRSFLASQRIKLDADSGFHLGNEPMAGKSVSLSQFMTGNGWDHPVNEDELVNLHKELLRPVEYRQLHGDFGGGLSWPTPLDQQQQQAIHDAVTYNSMGLPELNNLPLSQNAFGYLTQTAQLSEDELKNPRQALLTLLQNPVARALGEALRSKFQGRGSVDDWVLSALQIGLNQNALWGLSEKNKVAGFDLSADQHWGKPLSTVVKGLTEHLRKSYGNNAPVAAYLLLSHHAPELLVNDVPDNVTYGSPAWVSLKSIVAKAEMRTPGLAVTKTYAQLLKEDLNPITSAEKAVEALAGQEALIHWAVADGAIGKRADNNYSDEEIERAGVLASERFDTLSSASKAQRAPLLNRSEIALNVLRERFPKDKYGDIDFEKKAIWPLEAQQDLLGPYSILDIFLKRQQHTVWVSDDPVVPIATIAHDLSFLPSVNEQFEKNVAGYYDGLKGAMDVTVKHLMSVLPKEDREALEQGELNIYGEDAITQTEQIGGGNRNRYVISQAEETKASTVFVETVHKGKRSIYEVNPTKGILRIRADLADGLKSGVQGQWQSIASGNQKVSITTNTRIKEINASAEAERTLRGVRPQPSSPASTFSSARTQHIADAVTRHFFRAGEREALIDVARGATTFDTEVTVFEKIQAVTRALVPFASAIDSFQQGKVGEGLTFLAFDVFGFVLGGVGAANKVARLGASASKAGIFTRAAISAANPFAGGKAIVGRGLPLHWSGLGKGTFSWKVVSTNRSVDRVYQSKPKDVVVGTYAGDRTEVAAVLDDATKTWYRYDMKNHRAYGTPLEGFRAQGAQPPSTTDSNA